MKFFSDTIMVISKYIAQCASHKGVFSTIRVVMFTIVLVNTATVIAEDELPTAIISIKSEGKALLFL